MANTTGQKFGGRKVGTTNKDKTNVRAKFQLLVENNIDTLQSDLDSLKPFDRVKAIIDLSKFVLPTLKAIDYKNTDEVEKINRVTINFVKKDGTTN
jgi:hypothetical protein